MNHLLEKAYREAVINGKDAWEAVGEEADKQAGNLRKRLAERDKLIGVLYRGLKEIDNAALDAIVNHRDIIHGIALTLINSINYWQE